MSEIAIDEEKRRKIQSFCDEMSASMTRRQAEGEFQREAVKAFSKEHDIPKKLLRKMAKVYHTSRFSTETADHEEFASAYRAVFREKAI